MTFTSENYLLAVDKLKSVYESKKEILFDLLDNILDYPELNKNSVDELSDFLDFYSNAYFMQVDRSSISNYDLLLRILMRKLPHWLIHEWNMLLIDNNITYITSLFEFLDKQVKSKLFSAFMA